jgi:hypothetical protein
MVDGEVESAQVVTPKTINETLKDGTTVKKKVWVSLDTPCSSKTTVENRPQSPTMDYDPVDIGSPQPERRKQYQVSVS